MNGGRRYVNAHIFIFQAGDQLLFYDVLLCTEIYYVEGSIVE
jgi:hypothetical protein